MGAGMHRASNFSMRPQENFADLRPAIDRARAARDPFLFNLKKSDPNFGQELSGWWPLFTRSSSYDLLLSNTISSCR